MLAMKDVPLRLACFDVAISQELLIDDAADQLSRRTAFSFARVRRALDELHELGMDHEGSVRIVERIASAGAPLESTLVAARKLMTESR
jgi:hypothetical protein